MRLHFHFWRHCLAAAFWTLVFAAMVAPPTQSVAQESDAEETREKAVVDRFVVVLEKNPRKGTALDKIYGYHVERGSLPALIKTYREKTASAKATESASAWMIVGLLESLRGQDAASVEAFSKVEQLDPASYLASYYLGLSQVLIGQPDKAAEALERATQRKPAQADQLEIFQALGRVYQRAQKADKALDVWNRLEKQFPNDARVQEQIATTLLEEGEFASALPRYELLAKTTKDKYRQSLFQMEAAEIKVRLGQSADAIKEFESLLGQLNPDNWLYREVRRHIENVYLRTDDQAGLIAYYEGWLKKTPNDLNATARIARLLAGLGRGAEAQQWLEKALKIAPTNKELRLTLIGQLIYEQKFVDVIAQYEQLDKQEPNNPDTLREWGRVILKDTARDEATRKKDAASVWKRMTASKPKDPLVASQVAELFRQVEMTGEALELYQKAVSLAPEAAQYKEYLGEYFHSLKRKDEALATWRQIAEGNAKTAVNTARLAEVLSSFGYLAEAVETNAEACKLDPKDINLQIKQVDLLTHAERHEDALKQLDVVRKLAASDEEREAWLGRELKELAAVEKLKDRILEVQTELDERNDDAGSSEKSKALLAEKWFWLARAYEFERQMKEAALAITKASELAPQSIPTLMASGRIHEAQNNLLAAVEINTKLAAVDRRFRTEYLKKVAQLELQLGRRERGIQAGRDLIAAAPGNPELYEFFSQLCFQLGETEEGLQALRRSVRVNPTEPKGLLLLASALGDQFRTSEAIELYWRAFEKAANLDDRLGVVPKLAELYLQTNQLDRLLERLERQRREPNQNREMTICLAQAYQSAGDDGNARQELEKLLTEDTRDVQLLQQLVKLCESDGDLDMAVRYQQQMNKVSPGKEGTMRLAQLLTRAGEPEESAALMSQMALDEKDPEAVLKSIDALLTQKQFEQALAIVQKLTRDQPKNWELLYREGAILAKSKPDEAARKFETILALKLKDNEQGVVAQALAKRGAAAASRGSITSPQRPQRQQALPLLIRTQQIYVIRQAVELDNRNPNVVQQQQTHWAPSDYGQARLAAIGWQMRFAQTGNKYDEFVKGRKDAAANSSDRRDLIDAYYLARLTNDPKESYRILKRLSLRPDADQEIHQMYLSSLQGRGPADVNVTEFPADAADPDDVADFDPDVDRNGNRIALAPLDSQELDHVIAIAAQLASMREFDSYSSLIGTPVEMIALELHRAGRKAEARRMYADAVDKATEPVEIASLLQGVVQRGDYASAIRLLDRLAVLSPSAAFQNSASNSGFPQYLMTPQYQAQFLAQLMANRAREKQFDAVLALWERYLKIVAARESAPSTPQTIAAKKQQRASMQIVGNQYFTIRNANNSMRNELLDFPAPNDVYDPSSIQTLRQLFALFRDAGQTSQLIEAFARAAKDSQLPEIQRRLWQFGLGYLHWWNDEKDEALAVLNEASQQMPTNNEIKFQMARLHENRREFGEALALIDALTPADQAALQQREVMALRLSVNGGNIERARVAAERLFGLRLDSNLQMALARQMHQLGMHEQAEAVLARAGRQAGNRTEILASLMEQYASAGKNDVAIQMAHQLLRRSTPGANANQMVGSRTVRRAGMVDDSGVRTQALQVLNRSGKLSDMIAKVEAQLKNSPKSRRLLETILEYYVAAGNDKKIEEINSRLAEFKSDDPRLKFQLAMKLLDAGKTKEASEHLKVVFERQPSLVMNQYYELHNKYRNQMEDLASLYESIDLKVFQQQPYVLTEAIRSLTQQEQTKARGLSLFKKAWAAVPDSRSQLLGNMYDENFWKLPEIYEYAREGVIPTEMMVQQNPGLTSGSVSMNQNGRVITLNTRVLDIATSQKKLDELADDVSAAIKRMPAWTGGKTLRALIDLRRGKVDDAKATFEAMLPTLTTPNQTGNNMVFAMRASREIGQELMAHDSCADLAIKYFELAVANDNNNNDFQYTAGKPLFDLLKKRGRRAEARQVLINGARPANQFRNNPSYEAYRRIQTAVSIGKEFQDLGFPADAIKIYQRVLSNSEDLNQAKQYNIDFYLNQLKTALSQSLEQLKPESLAELLAPPTKPTNVVRPNQSLVPPRPGRNQAPVEEPLEDYTSVDLIVGLDSADVAKSRMTSALINLIAGLAKKPELLEKTTIALADACSKRPDDFGAAILATSIAITSSDKAARESAVDKMVVMIERLPLEAPPEKGGFTAKQRTAAMQQVQLWLVARDCFKGEELRASGEKLATRALESAKRLTDAGYALSILREWGQIVLDLGDPKTAEQKWSEMLDLVIPKPGDKPKKTGEPVADSGPRVVAIASGGVVTRQVATNAAAPLPVGSKGQAVNLQQFQRAAEIAKMAAENGLNDLSLRAIEQSLHAGPPLEAMQELQQGSPFGTVSQVNDQSQSVIQVQQLLSGIEQVWRRQAVTDERIYLVLRGAMLPEQRPLEVFLYPQSLANSRIQAPQSIGALVVRAAVKANRTDDLKQRLEKKLSQPLGDLAARVALTQLALAIGDAKAAGEQLDLIAERIKLDSIANTSDLACHAALPAIDVPELTSRAIVIVERAADHYQKNEQTTRNSIEEPTRSFRYKLAELHFRSGNVESGKKQVASWVSQLATMWSNYGGDYPQYRRKSEFLSAAAAYARYGQQSDSLELLGRHADLAVTRDYGEQPIGLSGALILNSISHLQPAEQYSMLKSWSLPTPDRRSVRMMGGLLPGDSAPTVFDSARSNVPRLSHQPRILSSAELLVRSAAATGKLAELRAELEPFAAENVENAPFLLLLTRLEQPDDPKIVADLRAWFNARKTEDSEAEKSPDVNRRSRRLDATGALITQAAIANKTTRETGLEICTYLIERYQRVFDQLHMAYMRHLYNSTIVGSEQSAKIDLSPHVVNQKYWTGSAHTTAQNENSSAVPMWWLAHEGKLQHICGPGTGYVFFNYPLTGTFEFSCDIWFGHWADGSTGYGGMVFDTLNSCQIFPIGRRQHTRSKPNMLDAIGKYNRFSIQVTPNSIKNFVNGALAYEESTANGTTTPWLVLHAERDWQTAFANARIDGQPTIPEEVSLSDSPTLLGWSGVFYGEALPALFAQNVEVVNRPSPNPTSGELDWSTANGEIRGRHLPPASLLGASVLQSHLQYHRPLLNGDRLSYEFWYEPGPGAIHVHPALDRLAMLLEPDGVKLHWLTETNDESWLTKGLPANNMITDEAAKRGPGQLPLKSRDWNRVDVSLKDDTLTLTLNGQPIFERLMEPENNRQFGFYHDKHATSVRVRHVVLKGDWPKSLSKETLGNLLAPARQHSPEERHRLARAFDDKYEVANLDNVLLLTRGLPLADRYARLKTWVLPNDDHATIRLYGDTAPADPAPVTKSVIRPVDIRAGKSSASARDASDVAAKAPDSSPAGSIQIVRRARSGGELISPALDLIAVAKELGKLDELAKDVRDISESSPFVKRARLAMLTLIAIADNNQGQASAILKELTPPRDKGLPDDLSLNERSPEWIVGCEASQIPELRQAAMLLLDLPLDSVNRKGIDFAWDVKVRSALQHAMFRKEKNADLPLASAVSPKGQWAQATLVKAVDRGHGMVPRWRIQGTEAAHLGGEGNDPIYFQSPLRGRFTVDAELSTFGWREARPMYGAQWAGPQFTLEAADLGNLTSSWVGPKFPVKLQHPGDWYRMRLEVTPEKATYYANEQVIFEQTLSEHTDPWFAIHSFGHYAASLKSLRITGDPEIPTELQLSKRDDLQGWWGQMYGDPIAGDNAMWKKNGDEITGTRLGGWEGRTRESLLQYHRPMLEDGEITYEFFYAPHQTHVHPALGRMVLLLDPEGVKVHWLTDAQYERGGLAQGNVSVEPQFRRHSGQFPLKANDWNKLNLSLRGDTLTLALNGEGIYERPLEATNLRTFGLFHYAGDTDVRVKNVVYQGNWPRALPTVEEQEFALRDKEVATSNADDLPDVWSSDFKGRRPGQLTQTSLVATNMYTVTNDGLRIAHEPNPDPKTDSAGLRWAGFSIEGDFDVRLGYRDFQSKATNEDFRVPRVEILLGLGGAFNDPQHVQTLALTHTRRRDNTMYLTSILGARRDPATEDWKSSDHQHVATDGRIRIARRGGTAYYLHSKLGSDDWELLDRRQISMANVKDLIIGLRSEDLTASASVMLTEVAIRAKRLHYRPEFAKDELPAQFTWNFQGPLPEKIQTLAAELPNRFEPVADGTKINRPDDPKQSRNPVGFQFNRSLHGDFEITLSYRDFESATTMTDWQVPRIEINVPIGGPEWTPAHTHSVVSFHLRRADGTLRHAGGFNERKPDNQNVWNGADLAAMNSSGQLRLVRQGKMVFAMAAPSGSDDFQVVFKGNASSADVPWSSFRILSEGQSSRANAVFTEWSIRAQSFDSPLVASTTNPAATVSTPISGPAPFGARDLPAKITWNFQGPRPRFFTEWGSSTKNELVNQADGIKVIRRANVETSDQAAGFQFDGGLDGDFEITLDYRDFVSKSVLKDWQVPRVDMSLTVLSMNKPAESTNSIAVALRRNHDGGLRFLAVEGEKGAEGKFVFKSTEAKADRPSGRLRLVRQENAAFYQVAPPGSEDWLTISRGKIEPGPVRWLSIGLRAEDLQASGEVALTNITIRANALLPK